jgi:CheY-like chemotaxis protein
MNDPTILVADEVDDARIILATALRFPRDRQRALGLSCVSFVPKPASPGEVIREIRRCVGAPRHLEAAQPELAGL